MPYRIVIEPQEFDQYAAVIDPAKILVLPFSNLGRGSIPARNWVWEHSLAEGHERHWILDDNIRDFWRLNERQRVRVWSGEGFAVIEDLVSRYANVAQAGMQYTCFGAETLTKRITKPFRLNTRIYSCILNLNKLPFRWRGRYNEDTDLSLRCLKAGWCTMLVIAYLCNKVATMTMKGGNTDTLYRLADGRDGRLEMARSLVTQHPDVTRIYKRWGRWQHLVDYKPFQANKLIRNPAYRSMGA